MHKLMSKPITRESFEMDDFCEELSVQRVDQSEVVDAGLDIGFKAHWHMNGFVDCLIEHLEDIRQDYIRYQEVLKFSSEDPEYIIQMEDMAYQLWKELVRWLPESWLQTRTVTLNYENLLAICSKGQRRFHKLNEWSGKKDKELINFIAWARTLPYAQQFIFIDELVTPGELCGKSMREIIHKLPSNLTFDNLGIAIADYNGNCRPIADIFKDLAIIFDKNEIF